MDINLTSTLDEVIAFVLSDKYLAYNTEQVNSIIGIMNQKIDNIDNPDEKIFFQSVVEELTSEMLEMSQNTDQKERINPIKERYDKISEMIEYDVQESIKRGNTIRNKYKIVFKKTPNKFRIKYQSAIKFGHIEEKLYLRHDVNSVIHVLSKSISGIQFSLPKIKPSAKNVSKNKKIFSRRGKLNRKV